MKVLQLIGSEEWLIVPNILVGGSNSGKTDAQATYTHGLRISQKQCFHHAGKLLSFAVFREPSWFAITPQLPHTGFQ